MEWSINLLTRNEDIVCKNESGAPYDNIYSNHKANEFKFAWFRIADLISIIDSVIIAKDSPIYCCSSFNS